MEKTLVVNKQEEIMKKISIIEKALGEIQVVNSAQFKTNGLFQYNPNGLTTDIKYKKCIKSLLEMVSFLNAKEEGYQKAAQEMGLESYPQFTWIGYTTEDWKHDIKIRLSVLTSHEQRERLLKAKETLEKYVSEETKMLKDLEMIDSLFGGKG
jgi:hypothetical protein